MVIVQAIAARGKRTFQDIRTTGNASCLHCLKRCDISVINCFIRADFCPITDTPREGDKRQNASMY